MDKITYMIELLKTIEKDNEFPVDVRCTAVEAQIPLMKLELLLKGINYQDELIMTEIEEKVIVNEKHIWWKPIKPAKNIKIKGKII